MILTAGELESARADIAATLPDTCVVRRVTRTANDSGGWTETTVDAPAIACRIGPVSGRERLLGGKIVEEADAVVTFAHNADITGKDRIVHNTTTYEVIDVQDRSERLMLRVPVRTS